MNNAPHPGFKDWNSMKTTFSRLPYPHSSYPKIPEGYDSRTALAEDPNLSCTRSTKNPAGDWTILYEGDGIAVCVDDQGDGTTSLWIKAASRETLLDYEIKLMPPAEDRTEPAPPPPQFPTISFDGEAF